MVITGGILRDGSLYVDIAIVNLATLEVSRCAAVSCLFLKLVGRCSVMPLSEITGTGVRDERPRDG